MPRELAFSPRTSPGQRRLLERADLLADNRLAEAGQGARPIVRPRQAAEWGGDRSRYLNLDRAPSGTVIPSAVEELLRFDSPVQTTFRRTLADCDVNGFELRKRDSLVVLVGSLSVHSGGQFR